MPHQTTLPAAALGAALLMSGCVPKPPPVKEGVLAIDAPAAYRSKLGVATSDADWVKQLSKDRTLNKLIDEVKANNWDIKKAAARVMTAKANAEIAGAARLPHFSTGLDGRRSQQAFIGFPFSGDDGANGGANGDATMPAMDSGITKSLSNNFGLSLDVSWEIDLWGRIRTGQEAYIAEVQATAEDLRGLGSSLAAQTAKVWFAMLEADEQIALAQETLVSFNETTRTLRDSFEAGNGSAAQLRVAKADVETAKALLEERKGQKRATQRQLEVLLGRYPGAEIESAGKLPDMPKPPPPGVPSDLLRRRSDIAAAERRLAVTDRRIKEAKLALFPQISLTGSGGTASDMLRNVTDSSFGVWSIAGRAGQQLFRGGEVLGNVKLRKVAQSEAYIDYQRAAISAFEEVETRLDNEIVLRKREDALRAAEENLIAAYKRSLEEYRGGVGSSTNLLLTQRQMLNVRAQVLTLRRLRLDNRVDLHLALGGSIDEKV